MAQKESTAPRILDKIPGRLSIGFYLRRLYLDTARAVAIFLGQS
jgi:hypothetical protein